MDYVTVLGLVAALLTTSSFIPQVARTVRTKRTADISRGMYLMLFVGFTAWLAYGIMIRSLPVIAANTVSMSFAMAVIVMKLKYK